MALRIMRAVEGQTCSMLGLKAMANVLPHFSPLSGIMDRKDSTPPLVLPEFNHESDSDRIGNCSSVGFGFPSLSFSGSMELMAVPKRKVLDSPVLFFFFQSIKHVEGTIPIIES